MAINLKPIIGIVGCHREIEDETAHLVKARYVTGVRDFAGAIPLIVPGFSNPSDAIAVVERLDGVLLTGAPSNMKNENGEGRGPFDPVRDETSLALIKAAQHLQVPLFGICRGLQEINVALGGTLKDQRDSDEAQNIAHHTPDGVPLDEMFACHHQVEVSPGSRLSGMTKEMQLEVNSVHFQMVDQLGDGLRVEAASEDGVVEAIAARDGSELFAVQWHPEWRPAERPHHLAFWEAFGRAARGAIALRLAKSV